MSSFLFFIHEFQKKLVNPMEGGREIHKPRDWTQTREMGGYNITSEPQVHLKYHPTITASGESVNPPTITTTAKHPTIHYYIHFLGHLSLAYLSISHPPLVYLLSFDQPFASWS